MQDIATALKSAIKDWEVTKELNTMQKPAPAPDAPVVHQWDGALPTDKQPVAHTIFNYVRDNPGMRAAQYVDKLVEKGLIRGSISSYLYQMLDTNLLYADADRKLYTKHVEYKTLKQLNPKAKTTKAKKPVAVKPKATVPVPAPAAVSAPTPVRTVHVQQKVETIDQDVERIMSMLNVRTAHKLSEALNKLFKTDK